MSSSKLTELRKGPLSRAFSSSGRRDLNSGPLVPQTAPALGWLVSASGLEWTKCLQIAGIVIPITAFLHTPTPDVRAAIGQRSWRYDRHEMSRERLTIDLTVARDYLATDDEHRPRTA